MLALKKVMKLASLLNLKTPIGLSFPKLNEQKIVSIFRGLRIKDLDFV